MKFLSGFVAIIGPPNVGKSTLLNRILGTKLAIVSPKPQTTRNRIIGIYHGDGFQIVFTDTPGIHVSRTALHKSMVASARAACREVDTVLLMIEIGDPEAPEISSIIKTFKKMKKPCVLVINKVDTKPKELLLPIMDRSRHLYSFDAIIPISALKGDGVEELLEQLKLTLRPGPQFFPEDMKTDQSEVSLVSEIIREKIFSFTKKELPYSTAVTVVKLEEMPAKDLFSILADIHVEKESQKGMLIGKSGRMIRAIGRAARLELQKIFGVQIFLDLRVKVNKDWSKDPRALRKLGY
jgi:GTP-binding protein Era